MPGLWYVLYRSYAIWIRHTVEILLAALIIFYIIGCLARHIIERVMVSNRFVKEVTDEMVKEAQEAAQEESSESEEAEETSDH